jgi:putative ABC transport system permease protein
MNVVTRGIRNAFRNLIRSFSIIVILGLSVGLTLSMLVAHQAVGQKISSIEGSVGNTVMISPAGVRGFEGGGNPLTETQLVPLEKLAHVTSIDETLNDRLTTANTNLQSAISAGALGQRFAGNNGQTFISSGGFGGRDSSGGAAVSFTPPVIVLGTNNPTNLSSTQGGGSFKLTTGQVFSANSVANVALVGSDLATKNNLKVGSTFTAYSTSVTVVGIYDAGNTFSNNQIIMPLSTVQKLSTQTGDLTSATINVDSITNVSSVTTAAQKVLGSAADVTNASQQAQSAIAPLKNIQTISLYSLIGAVVAGAVIIFLVMIMIVRERRREIGVLKAIGASNIKIITQFVTEAITLTILGAVIGIGLGTIAGNPITRLLVNNSTNSATTIRPGGGGFGGRGIRAFGAVRNGLTNIHGVIGWSIILYGLVAAIVIAIVGSTLASFFIAKIRPAEVMRTE